jgi:hypothetical protein
MVNPDIIRAQLEGGVMFGLSAALRSEVIIANGRVRQSNFHDYRALRLSEAPPRGRTPDRQPGEARRCGRDRHGLRCSRALQCDLRRFWQARSYLAREPWIAHGSTLMKPSPAVAPVLCKSHGG